MISSNCINWKIHCDDHFSLSSTSALFIYESFHILYINSQLNESDITVLIIKAKTYATLHYKMSIGASSVHVAPCLNKTRKIFIKYQEDINRNVPSNKN